MLRWLRRVRVASHRTRRQREGTMIHQPCRDARAGRGAFSRAGERSPLDVFALGVGVRRRRGDWSSDPLSRRSPCARPRARPNRTPGRRQPSYPPPHPPPHLLRPPPASRPRRPRGPAPRWPPRPPHHPTLRRRAQPLGPTGLLLLRQAFREIHDELDNAAYESCGHGARIQAKAVRAHDRSRLGPERDEKLIETCPAASFQAEAVAGPREQVVRRRRFRRLAEADVLRPLQRDFSSGGRAG
jgi:hypothetical protein